MKPIQQRRLFFQAATSNTERKEGGQEWKRCFRLSGWIAVILSAALLIGCTSLTPDRVNVLAAIAGNAAAHGAAEWLAKHPEHRDAFNAVITELAAIHKNGNTNEQALEHAFVERMASLPTDTLRGPDGELYVTPGSTNAARSAQGGLVVWDAALKKSVAVRGTATRPVLKATLSGLKRAMVPQPPAPIVARARKPGDLEGRAEEGVGTPGFLRQPVLATNVMRGYGPEYPLIGATTNNTIDSTFVVTLNEHGIQQVNVRWAEGHGRYVVQRQDEGKAWEGWATVTNATTWTTLWPAPVAVGQWRVVR